MATALLASNQSAVFIRTQAQLGTWIDPTPSNGATPPVYSGAYAIRAIGAPKFAVRGAGIIDRKEVFTPWAGNTSSRTGGLGWDITLQTEFFWLFNEAFDITLANQTQLAALTANPDDASESVASAAAILDTLRAERDAFRTQAEAAERTTAEATATLLVWRTHQEDEHARASAAQQQLAVTEENVRWYAQYAYSF